MKVMYWIAVVSFGLGLPQRVPGATYTVTKTADSGDATLRWAIEAANTNPGPDTIAFSIAAAPYRITPASPLPIIFGSGGPVTLDGTTQPGYAGPPLVTLHGGTAGGEALWAVSATSVVIKALAITAWATGVKMQDCLSNRVENCRIWTNTFDGIYMQRTSWSVVGGSTNRGNLIASNGAAGVFILDNSRGNIVSGNRIGTDGLAALPNGRGIYLADVNGTVIGGTAASNRNIISGSINEGILLSSWASNTTITGNYIGTDQAGTSALGNDMGINVQGASNTIGGAAAGARNIIAGNNGRGVDISTANAHGNTIKGNWIGLGAGGQACSNSYGIFISSDARENAVGGAGAGDRNVISGNRLGGVYLDGAGTSSNAVLGNYIGTDAAGLARVANQGAGIVLRAAYNRIGGSAAGEGNLISGNESAGIYVNGANGRGNSIRGNWIGVNVTGSSALGNDGDGIDIADAPDTVIGGAGGAMNVISANGDNGISLLGGACANTVIAGNRIGLAPSFFANLGNAASGVLMDNAPSNSVGTGLPGEANVIANNRGAGITVMNAAAIRNRFLQNGIHNNAGLGIDLGGDGVTPNDSMDPDAGPNQYQNYPVLTLASNAGATMAIGGYLNSAPLTQFVVEFFGSSDCDSSGHGEGEVYLGEQLVITDAAGNAGFTNSLIATPTPPPSFVTATARDVMRFETSEFSRYRMVDSDGDGMADGWEYANFGSVTGGDPAGHSDGDGVPDLGEFIADTEPFKDFDYPRMSSISVSGATIWVTAPTSPSRVYTLEFADRLDTGSWGASLPARLGTGEPVRWGWSGNSNMFFRCTVALP